jgi:hypothetical protein
MRTRAIRNSLEHEVSSTRAVARRESASPTGFADNRPQSAAHRHWQDLASSARKPWSLIPVVSSSPPFARPAATAGITVQCVGGAKFGLQVTGNQVDGDVAEGLVRLKRIYGQYKAQVKDAKDRATAAFKSSGKMDDADTQRDYSQKLANAELTPEGLVGMLADGLTSAGDAISYNGKEVARIRRGAAAYVQSQAAARGVSAVYKKHTLAGPSASEYVDIGGHKLRRYAYREITPPERKAYKTGAPLRPANVGRETTGSLGYKYEQGTGARKERKRDESKGKVTDLEWLNKHAGTNLGSVPNDRNLLAFMQTRKGVNKALSATSTPKEITSNAGATFAGFGRAKIDLAQVPTASMMHHYKGAAFTDVALNRAVGRNQAPRSELTWETDRANETVRRNRELVLSEIPAAAVVGLEEAANRLAYEQEFRNQYIPLYQAAFSDELEAAGLDDPPPVPTQFPYVEDHYGVVAARGDATPLAARSAAAQDARTRVEFANEYRKAYKSGWKRGYEDAAWDSPWASARLSELTAINVPMPPEDFVVPAGTGGGNGKVAGATNGEADGGVAGAGYTG